MKASKNRVKTTFQYPITGLAKKPVLISLIGQTENLFLCSWIMTNVTAGCVHGLQSQCS